MYEIKELLEDKKFVKEIEYLKEERRKNLFLRYSKIILINFSILFVKEIWKEDQLFKYSYFWISANNKLIMGWDNAPHHEKIQSFPYHKHIEDRIEPADEKNLIDVIDFIEKKFSRDIAGG